MGHQEGEWRLGDTRAEVTETLYLSEEMRPLDSMGKKSGHHSCKSPSFRKALCKGVLRTYIWKATQHHFIEL